MNADDLIDSRFMVTLPLWTIGNPSDPTQLARVDLCEGPPGSPGLPGVMLFTDEDLATQCLPNFPSGWTVIKFSKPGALATYLIYAERVGLHHVAFDPGGKPIIYSIDRILDRIYEQTR